MSYYFYRTEFDVIRKMGHKAEARNTMIQAGVPVIPGSKEPIYDAKTGAKIAEEIGYPVIVKAALGGGGKGMRVAQNADEFEASFQTAQKEAEMHLQMAPCTLNILYSIHAILNFRFWQTAMET